ncbi:hypothetical protein ACFLWY_01685 [Chloroflexota bacterium]
MNVSDWITLSAVLVALGLGVSSLIQTQILRKIERRERILKEIIEWAQEIEDFSIAPNVQFAYIQDPKERQTIEDMHWVDTLDSKARHGKLIKSRAQILNSITISQSIVYLITELEELSGMFIDRDCPPLVYKPIEFLKVEELNKKALDLIIELYEYKS